VAGGCTPRSRWQNSPNCRMSSILDPSHSCDPPVVITLGELSFLRTDWSMQGLFLDGNLQGSQHTRHHRVEAGGKSELDDLAGAEMLGQLGVHVVRHVTMQHGFGQCQRRTLGGAEARRLSPEKEVLDLFRRNALLSRPAPMLMPFIGGSFELSAAQDHELAQRARGRAVAPQRVGKFDPCRQQLGVVSQYSVQIEELAVQLPYALLVLFVDFLERKTRLPFGSRFHSHLLAFNICGRDAERAVPLD